MSKNLISSLTINWKYQRKWVSSDRTLNFQSLCSCTILTSSAEFCSAPSSKKLKIESYLMDILEDLSLFCTYYSRKWRHMENKEVTVDNQRCFTKKIVINWQIWWMRKEKFTSCIWFCAKHSMFCFLSLCLKWRQGIWQMGQHTVDKKLAAWSSSKICSQWFDVQIKINNKWCSLGTDTRISTV